jgi:hypothetical protein
MIIDEITPVARALVGALADADVTLTAAEIEATQHALARRLWPLLDEPSRQLLSREGWDPLVRDGRAILLSDGRYWTGQDQP